MDIDRRTDRQIEQVRRPMQCFTAEDPADFWVFAYGKLRLASKHQHCNVAMESLEKPKRLPTTPATLNVDIVLESTKTRYYVLANFKVLYTIIYHIS